MCAHVVVAEDDEKQAELVRRYLEREGHTVVVVHDGRAALDEIRRRPPDLLVLDVMMPKVDGLDVCRILRAGPDPTDLPVLMLTARSTEDDLLLGLDLGADDYMTKPFSPRELMARVRTLLRRSARTAGPAQPEPDPVLTVGPLTVDPGRHEVWATGNGSSARRASSGCSRCWPRAPARSSPARRSWNSCTASTATSPRGPSTST